MCTDSDRFDCEERVVVKECVAAIRILYSLDVDWSVLADISSITFNIHLASGVFARTRLQTFRETHGGELARMAFCVDFDCPGECR